MTTEDISAIPGLFAADQRQLVHAVNTIMMITTWSPAVHKYFPSDDRKAIVDTLLELKKAGLPNDVIVGHVLPSTFAPPWAESPEESEEARNARLREERALREERQRQIRAAMGPGHPGMMNAAAAARSEGRALPYTD